MSDFDFTLSSNAGPYRMVTLRDTSPDPATGLNMAVAVGFEHQTRLPIIPKYAHLNFGADVDFSHFVVDNPAQPYRRYQESVRSSIRLHLFDVVVLEALWGFSAAQVQDAERMRHSLNFTVQGQLGLEFCTGRQVCITPYAGMAREFTLAGNIAYDSTGYFFGVRVGGGSTPHEIETDISETSAAKSIPAPRTNASEPPRTAESSDTFSAEAAVKLADTARKNFGAPDRFAENLPVQRQVATAELERYVTLFFLTSFLSFDPQFLGTLPQDALATLAWRHDPQLFVRGLDTFVNVAGVDRDPKTHPTAAEKNGLLLFDDLLQATADTASVHHSEIAHRAVAAILEKYHDGGAHYVRGTELGCNLYLAFMRSVESTTLPDDAALEQMRHAGTMNQFVDQILQFKHHTSRGAP